jgi:hypothetical protein
MVVGVWMGFKLMKVNHYLCCEEDIKFITVSMTGVNELVFTSKGPMACFARFLKVAIMFLWASY